MNPDDIAPVVLMITADEAERMRTLLSRQPAGIDPPISAADVGRWFISRGGHLYRLDRHDPFLLHPFRSDEDSFTSDGNWAPRNDDGSYPIHHRDIVRRATAADFLRLAMDTLGRDTQEATRLVACLEVFADELEASGNNECEAVRDVIRPPELDDEANRQMQQGTF